MQVNSTNAAASTAPVRAEPSPPAQLDSVDRSHERVRARLAPNVVDISPAARARVKMTRAGVSGPVEFARTVKAVVGEGEPNAELKARVLGLIVGVLTTRRIEVRRVAQEQAGDQQAERARIEEARRAALAEGAPKPAIQLEPAGVRFPSPDAYDESDEGVVSVAGNIEAADGGLLAFSAGVAIDDSARADVSLPDAVEKLSVQARLPFDGASEAVSQRRFSFTVTAGAGEGPIEDRLRVWEHSGSATSLTAVGVAGMGPVMVGSDASSSESAA